MTVLVVAAHPDDEALGCGGTIRRLTAAGQTVHLLFVCDGVRSRSSSGIDAELHLRQTAARDAAAILGAQKPRFLAFPDNSLDSVPLLDVVQAIESVVGEIKPATVYTHHAGDLNIDHALVTRAVLSACRPLPGSFVRQIYSFEVPSSTEWSGPAPHAAFAANRFVDITATLDAKLQALDAYHAEMRPFPHPRSREAVTALARVRGATAGLAAAEAFMVLRQIEA
jgi:LmbE family N-acetylglucosaminyl deacetylase